MWVACFLIPHLPVRVEWQRDPTLTNNPLIIGGRRWDEGAVLDCCPQAVMSGVEPGMRLSRAEALCPEACFLPSNEEMYEAVHQSLLDAARHFTPIVETHKLGLVHADISGLKWRFDSDFDGTQHSIGEVIGAAMLGVQIGLASGKFVAQQAAQVAKPGETYVVPAGEEEAFLSSLDISILPLDQEMERRLRMLGVHTLGALAKLPRVAVLRQFGSSAGAVYDLARGEDARPVHADAPPLRLTQSHSFVDPLNDRRTLLAHMERLIHNLAKQIGRHGYQAEGLLLEIEMVQREKRDVDGASPQAIGKPVKPPSSNADRLSRLGARMLGGMTIDGPVTHLTLTVFPLRPFHQGATQLTLFGPTAISPFAPPITFGQALRETLRRLRDRFGELSVLVASLVVAPAPCPVQATTDREGLPRSVVWRERIWKVQSIYEHWRERRHWWAHPIERDYFRLEIATWVDWVAAGAAVTPGSSRRMKVIFRDVRTDQWYMERRHI